ncbi:DNA starvation/stationary phase protection protein [Pontixanthobacter aestiaquae]|uniref:DNA starvation/stationary phase protection protein n=1 Tax=Pontixanthobacter aestiaquae TaxID=1509367 RepID=A0A844Z4H1_9SPHN|nr:DNA starvation/stationary phase protection protein [Pontixanthobacter aestiaquae]MDN3646392.1 DNA starvation/stationary phase protection protein [Pontixanthobacter aestiaquae]MXO82618.1 DNA starvation/stationary phase protection protein [Pontixanthobacter aestiaquae]
MTDTSAQAGNNSKAALVSELNGLLADHMALFFKTKNFHWHVAGPRFRDLHLLFDEHAIAIRDQIDVIGERVRKLGENTLTSIGSIAQHTQVKDQDDTSLSAEAMIEELRDDNAAMVARLKGMKPLAEQAGDNATDGLLDDWTDAAEERVWFLTQTLK